MSEGKPKLTQLLEQAATLVQVLRQTGEDWRAAKVAVESLGAGDNKVPVEVVHTIIVAGVSLPMPPAQAGIGLDQLYVGLNALSGRYANLWQELLDVARAGVAHCTQAAQQPAASQDAAFAASVQQAVGPQP